MSAVGSYASMREQIDREFEPTKPREDHVPRLNEVRKQAHTLALIIDSMCPHGREKRIALTKLSECWGWANAAISREKT